MKRTLYIRVAAFMAFVAGLIWLSLARTTPPTKVNPRTKQIEKWISQLRDPDDNERGGVATKLGETNDPAAIVPLIDALSDQNDAHLRSSAAWALGGFTDKRVIEPLIRALSDEDRSVRQAAAATLGDLGAVRAIRPLSEHLLESAPAVHSYDYGVAFVIGKSLVKIAIKTHDPNAVSPLLTVVDRNDVKNELKIRILDDLTEVDDATIRAQSVDTQGVLTRLLDRNRDDNDVRVSALGFLDAHPFPGVNVASAASRMLRTNDIMTRLAALKLLHAHPGIESKLEERAGAIAGNLKREPVVGRIARETSGEDRNRWRFEIDLYNTTAREIALKRLAVTIDKDDRIFYNKEAVPIDVYLAPFGHGGHTSYWVSGPELRGGVCTISLAESPGAEVTVVTRLIR